MYNFRTDLALERRELLEKLNKGEELEGIEVEEKEINEKIKLSRVKITNENGEKAIGKPKGSYITIDIKKLKIMAEEEIEEAAKVLSDELRQLVNAHIESQEDVLVVGLGNEYITPDSLRTKGSSKYRGYKTYYKIYARICRRRNKTSSCNISRSTWYNRYRNFRNIRRNSR